MRTKDVSRSILGRCLPTKWDTARKRAAENNVNKSNARPGECQTYTWRGKKKNNTTDSRDGKCQVGKEAAQNSKEADLLVEVRQRDWKGGARAT